uniref:Uncharacterized protein n=1 Tax=Leersia perrieri TaxID=77586 RepID=A0A0D9VSQ9_9ORYZ
MDGQGQDGRKKANGNPYPRRGDVKRGIMKEFMGKTDPPPPPPAGNDGGGNGGGGDDAAAGGGDAGSYYGH